MDACSAASGIFFNGDWQYTVFNLDWPEVADLHINYKEVLSVLLAARRWGHLWINSKVTVFTDNSTARAIINKGTCQSSLIMHFIRELFWLAAIYNFSIRAVYMPGQSNTLADTISRLHEPGYIGYLEYLLREYTFSHNYCPSIFDLRRHMSNWSFMSLLPQIQKFVQIRNAWTLR